MILTIIYSISPVQRLVQGKQLQRNVMVAVVHIVLPPLPKHRIISRIVLMQVRLWRLALVSMLPELPTLARWLKRVRKNTITLSFLLRNN